MIDPPVSSLAMARGYNGYNLCIIYNGILGYINAVDITCTQTAWALSWRIFFHHQLGRSGHFCGGFIELMQENARNSP